MATAIAERLHNLRSLMSQHQLDFYYIPSRDIHNNEYVPECWQRRAFISNFTGSAGDVLVGHDCAYLWTDARYFLQAEEQLDPNCFKLMKRIQGASTPIAQWIAEQAPGMRVGVDPRVMGLSEQHTWQQHLTAQQGELISIDDNLVDTIWDNQPLPSAAPIYDYPVTFAGQSTADKLQQLRKKLKKLDADAHAINLLDAIAWLFNIRGGDAIFNPIAIAFALVTQSSATFFIDTNKVPSNLSTRLKTEGIEIAPYNDFEKALQACTGTVLLEPSSACNWMAQQLTQAKILETNSPITLMKAMKNPTEQKGAVRAHEKDAIALCKIFHWLENNWQGASEQSVSDKVLEYRMENPDCKGLSFTTISSYAKNSAINHYAVNAESNLQLSDDSLFLLDSGGQYFDGTTDVTRTVHFGTPTAAQKLHYTLVLKGHLALRHTVFTEGTCGEHLNAIAHAPLWKHGLDFGHGTGHGVGAFLCVHEGPQRISQGYSQTPLLPGMIVSNEPGVYFDNDYGIRIENLVLVVPKFSTEESGTGHGPFYGFEDLTLFPYARKLIDQSILSDDEIEQINHYHAEVYKKLHPNLSNELKDWLHEATKPL
jgi:Xaa-Pro aminopeptidase